MRKKVTIVGAGNVGATTALWLAERDYADIVLVDVVEGLPQGKALDLMQAGPIERFDTKLIGAQEYEPTAHSDLVIITSGLARRPGMSRDDLVDQNARIILSVVEQVVRYSPQCILLLVSNPLDAMVHLAYRISEFPKNRVLGQAGVLDTARFRTFIAWELDVSVEDVQGAIVVRHSIQRACTTCAADLHTLYRGDLILKPTDTSPLGGGPAYRPWRRQWLRRRRRSGSPR